MARNITIENFDDEQIAEIREHGEKTGVGFSEALYDIIELGLLAVAKSEFDAAFGVKALPAAPVVEVGTDPALGTYTPPSLLEKTAAFLGLGARAPDAPVVAAPDPLNPPA
jgi:hypothetical protein